NILIYAVIIAAASLLVGVILTIFKRKQKVKPAARKLRLDEQQERRELLELLKQVERRWLVRVEEPTDSTDQVRTIDITSEIRPDMVERTRGREHSSVSAVPSDKTIEEIFFAADKSLLILGEPGAGKTTALANLALTLIRHVKTKWGIAGSDDFDAFISYRREGGAGEARALKLALAAHNIRAFLDVDDLKIGHFDEALLRQIDKTPYFIVILTPNSLDCCADEDDWLRQEIAQAIRTDSKIIPVTMPDFKFPKPETLPPEIRALNTHQEIKYIHDFFNSTIERLVNALRRAGGRVANANAASE